MAIKYNLSLKALPIILQMALGWLTKLKTDVIDLARTRAQYDDDCESNEK